MYTCFADDHFGLCPYFFIRITPTPTPLIECLLFQSMGGGGARVLVPLAMPVTVVHPRFVNRGPKRGSGAGGGCWKAIQRFFFYSCMKTAFSCILNAIIGCVGVKWNRAIFQSMGGGGGTWDLPTEGQSEGVGGGCGRGKLPSQGRFLCLRTEGAGGIMFSGCPSVRIFFVYAITQVLLDGISPILVRRFT